MKEIEIIYKKHDIYLINVKDFYNYFNNFYQKFYDSLIFEKVNKMYKNFKEILKHILDICRA